MDDYRAVRLFVRYGKYIAMAVPLFILAVLLWAYAASRIGVIEIVLGTSVGLLLGFFVLVFSEITRIISEMLLPR